MQRHVRAHLARLKAQNLRREARRLRLGYDMIEDVIELEAEEAELEMESKRLVALENQAMNDHKIGTKLEALLARHKVVVACQLQTHGREQGGPEQHYANYRTAEFKKV